MCRHQALAVSMLAAGLLCPCVAAVRGADDTPSALERDPNGWVDLLAKAGPELHGWTRGPIPPTATLNEEKPSQWSLDTEKGILLCRGDRGHDWLRWDQEQG